MGDSKLSFEDPGSLQLDVLGTEPLEKSPAFTQQNRNQVDLQLVENAGGEGQPRGANAWTSTSFSPAAWAPSVAATKPSIEIPMCKISLRTVLAYPGTAFFSAARRCARTAPDR